MKNSSFAKLTTLTLAVMLLLLMALPIAADEAADLSAAFGEIVDVRVLNLEVVVTQKGDRVVGLGPQDFALLIDGTEVPIDFFTEVSAGQAVTSQVHSQSVALPAFRAGDTVGTRFLVFIDDLFALPSHRNRVIDRVIGQLSQLGPKDSMAVVAFDGGQVQLLSTWSKSTRELTRVLEGAKERRSYGLRWLAQERNLDSTHRFYRRGLGSGFGGRGFANVGFRGAYDYPAGALTYGRERQLQVARVAAAAASALRGFARPDGRKVMLLLSGGWPISGEAWAAGSYDYNSTQQNHTYSGLAGGRRAFRPLIDTANRLGYTLYPVDVAGLERRTYGSAEHRSVFAASIADERSRQRDWLNEDSLHYLAAQTGGRAFIDGASLSALEGVLDDTRSYYWLGFTPQWRENDEQHRIEVKTRVKGLKVRSRASFTDLSRQSEVTMLVESAQLFDTPLPFAEDFGAELGAPSAAGLRKILVPLRLEIPLDQVAVLAHQGGYAASLELRVAATDEGGDRADISVVPVTIQVGSRPEQGEVVVFETQLKLRKKSHRLLISLHDPTTGAVMSKRLAMVI